MHLAEKTVESYVARIFTNCLSLTGSQDTNRRVRPPRWPGCAAPASR